MALAFASVAACASQFDALTASEGSPDGNYGVATVGSGAGGTIVHDGIGGEGGDVGSRAPRCGEGCIPGLGVDAPCEPGGAGGGGGAGDGGTSSAGVELTCQLGVVDGVLTGQCGLAGTAKDGEPCLAASDCAPGFGCVEPGVCRAYCCGDPEACPSQTFCSTEPSSGLDSLSAGVPVCAPTQPCMLLDDSSCPVDGTTCTIVRADGTTSCVDEGKGKDGESCPCAAGHVCSFTDDRCLKLCRTNRVDDCPQGYQCSGGSKPYPEGFGVCVAL